MVSGQLNIYTQKNKFNHLYLTSSRNSMKYIPNVDVMAKPGKLSIRCA